MAQEQAQEKKVHRLRSHRRTITETDIVTFVNLVGLHEPLFIDMEFVSTGMEAGHQQRFAPAPLVISLGMGLVATYVSTAIDEVLKGVEVGPPGGLVGLEARVRAPVFPGDTIHVELEASLDRTTSRGYTLVALLHRVVNQSGEAVAEFTERAIFMPA